ncbi:hypothetical protein FRB94_007770 [Tulasnella sp. JGI-2019a]|nr:hypothetical protein FRB93_007152 [Tulasnella sp. JGI-2019a]KAG8997321.1 hypothetical protein FRB94_007770 [Tulasnella sp. JGI-2019a]KAG9028113.1 hypothetical protein FRB95_006837 [Tulasnella sp. JGI-2019a]
MPSSKTSIGSGHGNAPALNTEPLESIESKELQEGGDVESGTQSPTPTLTLVADETAGHLSGFKLASVLSALLLSIFLVVLDRTIVATAIPVITSDFHSLGASSWIATVYFLTQAGCLLTFGQILSVAPTLWVYLTAIGIFELGSVFCGAARSMTVLIIGRAIAGMGSAGVMVACIAIVSQITRLDQRPMVFGFFAGTLALGSIVGPLLGGALTERASWRWCFLLNLPLGAITIGAVLLLLRPSNMQKGNPSNGSESMSLVAKILKIDWVGSVFYFSSATCILIALQSGGVDKPWNDKSIIILFAVGGALGIAFLLWEHRLGEKAVLPLRLFSRMTTVGASIDAFMIMLFVMVGTYYLPLFYQSARQRSAVQAGIDVLPFMLATVAGNVASSWITTRTGKPWPWLFGGPLVAALGSGLLFWALTNAATPSLGRVIAFQILLGVGAGSCVQQSLMIVQAEYRNEPKIIPQVSALMNALQLFGGMVGVAISGTIFSNKLRSGLTQYAPGLPDDIKNEIVASVTGIGQVPSEFLHPVLHSYSNALGYVFIMGVPVGVIASLAALLVEKHDLKRSRPIPGSTTATSTGGHTTPSAPTPLEMA